MRNILISLFLIVSGVFADDSLAWAKVSSPNESYLNESGIKLVYIPAGSFTMGSPEDEPYRTNDEVQHEVTLTRSFLMGVTEVTQAQFLKIMKVDMKELQRRRTKEADTTKNLERAKLKKMTAEEKASFLKEQREYRNKLKYPYGPRKVVKIKATKEQALQKKETVAEIKKLKAQYDKDKKAGTHIGFGPQHPIGYVSWNEAMEFCRKLTALEQASGALPKGWSYRLPTGAEWENACRAGSTGAVFSEVQPDLFNRQSIIDLKKYAWSNTNSANRTHPVTQLKPNPWGLYDIYGNVSEWCLDIFAAYTSEAKVDPLNVEGPGMMRVNRGLNSHCTMTGFRSAYRKTGGPKMPFYCFFGFRVVCAPVSAKTANVPVNHTNL